MSVVDVLARLGGVATRAELVRVTSRAEVDRALGELTVTSRGRYALPSVDVGLREAHRLAGALSWRSAALHWGWSVKQGPDAPDVTVPANRKVTTDQRRLVTLHRGDLHPSEISGGVTTTTRTLGDCLRGLPFDEALCVADSALRDGFSRTLMVGLAASARGPGSAQMRRVAAVASPEAANAFESTARAISLDVPGLSLRPQVPLYEPSFLGRPDLVDERLRIAVECDSFEWHGSRSALARDCRRYDLMAVKGWLVLRFAWEHVMLDAPWVRSILEAAVAERSDQRCRACRVA